MIFTSGSAAEYQLQWLTKLVEDRGVESGPLGGECRPLLGLIQPSAGLFVLKSNRGSLT